MLELMSEFLLFAPSSFAHLCSQPQAEAATWRSSRGEYRRIDYVLLPFAWQPAATISETFGDHVLSIGDFVDHRPARVGVKLSFAAPLPLTDAGFYQLKYKRTALRTQAVQDAIATLWDYVPDLPATFTVDESEQALTKVSRLILAAAAPPGTPAPKHQWIGKEVWSAMATQARCKKAFFEAVRWRGRSALGLIFATWASAASSQQRLRTSATEWDEFWQLNCHRAAFLSWQLKPLSARNRRMVRQAKEDWATGEIDGIRQDLATGSSASLWSFIRALSKRGSCRKGPKPIPVTMDELGAPIRDKKDWAGALERAFSREFSDRGSFMPFADHHQHVLASRPHLSAALPLQPPPADEWYELLGESLARQKKGRATGPDSIPVEFMQAGGSSYISKLSQLAAQISISYVPVAWKQGLMCAVPRKARLPRSISNVRGVLLASCASKVWAKAMRSRLVSALQSLEGTSQHGGVPGGSTEMAAHTVHLFADRAAHAGRCWASLFVDVRGAFYHTVAELVFGGNQSDACRQVLFSKLGLDDDGLVQLAAGIEQPLLATLDLPPGTLRLLQDWHAAAGFAVRGGDRFFVPAMGTKPGDPLADIVFNFSFHIFQRRLAAALRGAGLLPIIPVVESGPFASLLASSDPVELLPPAFFDDIAVLVDSCSAEALTEDLSKAAQLVISSAAAQGFEINFKPNKTEAVVHLCGHGADAIRKSLAANKTGDSLDHWGELVLPTGLRLRLVASYRHLGICFAATRAQRATMEMTLRTAAASSSASALARLFRRQEFTEATRLQGAAACVNSRALYGVALQVEPLQSKMAAMEAAMSRPLRQIAGESKPPTDAMRHSADHVLRSRFAQPSLLSHFFACKLRYFGRLVSSVQPAIFAMLAGDQCWIPSLIRALASFKHVCVSQLRDMPDPSVDFGAWVKLASAWPRQWSSLVRTFLKKAAAAAKSQPPPAAVKPVDDAEWLCLDCGAYFPSLSKLGQHRAAKHGVRREAWQRLPSAICPFCGVNFFNRERCIRHVSPQGKQACASRLLELPILTHDQLQLVVTVDRQWRRLARQSGQDLKAGPPAMPAALIIDRAAKFLQT